MGDPIFVDISNDDLPVFTAEDGDEEWNPMLINSSLADFKDILQELGIISVGRQSPEQMEKYPVPKEILKQFLKKVKEANAGVEIWWWEMLFDIGDE